MTDAPVAPVNFEKGATLGRYELLEKIGEGGMGQVWRARDTNLDRDVAIKHLRVADDAKSRERFRREALILSRLSHPGVATIFDFTSTQGGDFLVMEYVPGGSLASRLKLGSLPIDQAIRYGIAIAEALEAAHQNGFLHRDLKPGNIVISSHDHPKILDFGIARLLGGENAVRITQPGMAVGSLAYMSPEQLFGNADDVRADIYSLGVMLFEMVTGRVPFIKERPEALMYAIVSTAAPSARSIRDDVPVGLDRLIDDCLQKDASARPASAAAVAASLKALLAGEVTDSTISVPRSSIRSVAVLPLRNVSNDAAQDFFADGMTEMLISELSMIRELRVISLTSALKYRDTTLSIPEIARELNVNAILEGSIMPGKDRIRVNVRLVAARNDETLWSSRYDRDIGDILELQANLAETVAKEIEVQVSPADPKKLSRRSSAKPAAQVEFFKSRHHSIVGSREGLALSIDHARVAVEIDPDFALAWAAIADGHMAQVIRGLAPSAEGTRLAREAAEKAVAIDPLLADAHTSLGNVQVHTHEIQKGLASMRRAIELNPNHAFAQFMISRPLYALEHFEEAIEHVQKSVTLDPLSILFHSGLGDAYYFARQYDKSLVAYRVCQGMDWRFEAVHNDIARCYEALGRFDDARAAYEEGHRLSGTTSMNGFFGLAHIEAAAGHESKAREMLVQLKSWRLDRVVSSWGIAALHASLGDVDEAFEWLETAIQEKASGTFLLRVHPRLDAIRGDPRYWPMVERLGLVETAALI